MQEELLRKEKALRDTQIRSKHEMEKMKGAQVQQVDEFSIQKFRENQGTIQQLTFQSQQLQEQMNSMNSSGEFQDIESNYSGRLSHVSSQLEMIPSSRALVSGDKRLPLDTWKQSGVQENVFGNQFSTFDSPRDAAQRISSDKVQRNREAVPLELQLEVKTSLTSEDGQNCGTIPMPMFASRPFTTISKIRLTFRRITWSDSKDSKCRNYNSTSSLIPLHSQCGKFDSKIKRLVVLIFRRKL